MKANKERYLAESRVVGKIKLLKRRLRRRMHRDLCKPNTLYRVGRADSLYDVNSDLDILVKEIKAL
jgi:hypothetical protein